MEFQFEATSRITLEHQRGATTSSLKSVDFYLECTGVDENAYMNNEDMLTADGSKSVTQCFIQGLIANIDFAKEKGYWNEADHLRYVISELERSFVAVKDKSFIKDRD